MHTMNSQRGVPYDPAQSAAARKRRAGKIAREIEAVSEKKTEARKRDQIESAWRQRARDRHRS